MVPAQRAPIFIYGGSILPGNSAAQQVTVQDMFRAVGKHSSAKCRMPSLDEIGGWLAVGRGVRRTIHRQHHGDGIGGHMAWRCPIRRGACAYEIRRRLLHDPGEKVMN